MAAHAADWVEISAATLCVRGAEPDMLNNKIRGAVDRARDFYRPHFDNEPTISGDELAQHIKTAAILSRTAFRSGDVTTAAAHILFILAIISLYGDDILLDMDEYAIVVLAPELWTDISAVLHSGSVSDVHKTSIYTAYNDMDLDPVQLGR